MWVNPLLQALIDAAQSEQTSRTIRIVCTILVSLLYLIGLACLFLLVFVIEGQGLFIRRKYVSSFRVWYMPIEIDLNLQHFVLWMKLQTKLELLRQLIGHSS